MEERGEVPAPPHAAPPAQLRLSLHRSTAAPSAHRPPFVDCSAFLPLLLCDDATARLSHVWGAALEEERQQPTLSLASCAARSRPSHLPTAPRPSPLRFYASPVPQTPLPSPPLPSPAPAPVSPLSLRRLSPSLSAFGG